LTPFHYAITPFIDNSRDTRDAIFIFIEYTHIALSHYDSHCHFDFSEDTTPRHFLINEMLHWPAGINGQFSQPPLLAAETFSPFIDIDSVISSLHYATLSFRY
jgi:hypothetical protein